MLLSQKLCSRLLVAECTRDFFKWNFLAARQISNHDGYKSPRVKSKKINESNGSKRNNDSTNESVHVRRQKKIVNYLATIEAEDDSLHRQIDKRFNQQRLKQSPSSKNKPSNKNVYPEEEEELSSSGDESDEEDFVKLDAPNWSQMKLIPITKDFYTPSDVTAARSESEINRFCAKNEISANNIKPIFRFAELNLNNKVVKMLQSENMDMCTPIQSFGLPLALSGANMIATASNGSGKLTATILSAIIHISHQVRRKSTDGPIAVILVSTHEMVNEVEQIASQLAKPVGINCGKINEFSTTLKNCDLLISTPDSLYDCLDANVPCLHRCSMLSLYETDRLIAWGFEEEIHEILTQVRSECQRLMWSSLLNAEIHNFAISVLNDFARVSMGTSVVTLTSNPCVKQVVKVCEENRKIYEFAKIIGSIGAEDRTLIFTETKENAKKLWHYLRKKGLACDSLHNAKSKQSREKIVNEFQASNDIQFLVLTDVAARDLKFVGIKNVINYDFPHLMPDYVDRINRIGALNDSTAFTIFTEENGLMTDELIMELRKANQHIDPALFILQAANADSDDELSFAIPDGKGFRTFTIDKRSK